MMREKDGRSKGCAFVRYYSREAANAACATLNGTMALPGAARHLVVKYADAVEARGGRGGMGGGGRGAPQADMGGGMLFGSPMGGQPGYVQAPQMSYQRYVPAQQMGGGQQMMLGNQMVQMVPAGQVGMTPMGMVPMQQCAPPPTLSARCARYHALPCRHCP